jgi:NAD(P)-dependent dehydrogenase (short-subunit alcohol dehydrogenase family)
MATDHFGPFLFTKLLMPKLLAAATPSYTPRVVNVSSMGHRLGNGVDFELLERPTATIELNAMRVYVQAKSANILMALELAKRGAGKVLAYSLHPGSE